MKVQQQRGFTLLEAIIAFVVLAIGLTSMGVSFGLVMRTDGQLKSQRQALEFARSRLESAGIADGLVVGRRGGRDGELRWVETITLVRLAPQHPSQNGATTAPGVQAYWVAVAVEAAGGQVARLAALKIPQRVMP
ncbi:type IV pilus modification PilV family protein [Bradyrhizobium ganzhouense]|uniref:type IV pilus modification PilV family protein n=1 Tax=Bradyrhizobium ganzhouense TaxID=1179767 RepID=UPI003CF99AD7